MIADDRNRLRQAFGACDGGRLFLSLVRTDGSSVPVEAVYRDLRTDRLVNGFVVTMRVLGRGSGPAERTPRSGDPDELPAQVNRHSTRRKFRY